MARISSYKPTVGGVRYFLTAAHIEHLCMLFMERMPKGSVDLEKMNIRMIRDMCDVMLERFGDDALKTDLGASTKLMRDDYWQYFRYALERDYTIHNSLFYQRGYGHG